MDKEQERGSDFSGILHETLLRDDNVDLSVTVIDVGLGEAAEGGGLAAESSNPLHTLAHARRCTLPTIGALPCRVFLHLIERTQLIFGR